MDQMKSTMAGWLTVPKTKAEIEQNKAIAQAARKQQRVRKGSSLTQAYNQAAAKENVFNGQQQRNNNKKQQKSIKKKKKKPKKRTSWDESSSDEALNYPTSESEESFVEDDDESEDDDEVSYAEEESDQEPDQVDEVESDKVDDEDDEELLSPSPTPNNKNKNKKQPPRNTITLSDSDDSDSDSDVGFLSSSNYKKARSSKPSAALKRASHAAKNRYNQPISFSKTKRIAPPASTAASKKKNKAKKHFSDSDSDDDDSLLKTPPLKKKTSKYFQTKNNKNKNPSKTTTSAKRPFDDDSSSSNDDDDDLPSSSPAKRQRSSMDSLASVNNNKTTKTIKKADDDDDWMNNDSPASSMPNNNNKKTSSKTAEDSWMDESPASSMPSLHKKKKKKLSKKKNNKPSKRNPFAQFANHQDSDDYDDDEDEQLAMAMALSESMKDVKKDDAKISTTTTTKTAVTKKKFHKKTIDISDDENEPIFKEEEEDDSDGDDEDDDDVNDEGYDEEKEAATNVLQTAEGLSARVLQTMKTWMSSTHSDENDDAHKGMIIVEDGALALGGMNNNDNDEQQQHKNSKEWISQEYMQQVLPQAKLSKYQLIGVNWMALLHTMECKITSSINNNNNKSKSKTTNVNGILADEMGLGKTVQTIAFLAYLKHQKKLRQEEQNDDDDTTDKKEEEDPHIRPHLIVVPVSVLPNWVREFEKFAPEMNVVKYHGSLAEREELQNDLRQYLPKKKKKDGKVRNKKWAKHLQKNNDDDDSVNIGDSDNDGPSFLDVILAPVTYFQKEKSDDRKFLNKFQFDYLVVDEAHMLKNSQSTRYKMLDKIKTSHRLLLTGTPVQNSPQELLNMLCFIMPLFSQGGGNKSYDDEEGNKAASVSERMLQHFVEHETMEEGGDEEKAYQKLKRLFAPFVLRRKKSDVIAQLLPPKERVVEYVELDMEARSIYENILAAHVNKNGAKVSAAIGDHLFTNLRKAAHHPLLLRTRHTSNDEINHMVEHFHKYGAFKGEGSTRARVKEELTKFNDFHIHLTALELIDENPRRRPDLERYILPEKALFSSAKFTRLQTLLPSLISDGHRILIFSVWTSCLDLLGCLMEHLDLEYLRMDGSCPSNERQELIDRFNQDPSISIFLLSTKACGLGINLTAADTCIIHDLDFNPFNDLQAEDRCHRIGQKKKVTVYKMVTKETVDADIYNMQERKAKMNAAIMESKNNEKKERREMLNQEIQRFLGSPNKNAEKSTKKIDQVDFI